MGESFLCSAVKTRNQLIFTDAGITRFVMVLSADALIHASLFCGGKARAFIQLPMMVYGPAVI